MKLPPATKQLIFPAASALGAALVVGFMTEAISIDKIKQTLFPPTSMITAAVEEKVDSKESVDKQGKEPTQTPKKAEKKDGDKFIAVYMVDGKVYFGKPSKISQQQIILNDIYFLRVTTQEVTTRRESEEEGEEAKVEKAIQPNFELIRQIDEFPDPTDRLILNRPHIIFWEELKANSKVVTAIEASREK